MSNVFVKLYLISFVVFLGIDSIWLTFIAKSFYTKQIGFLMAKNPNLVAALIFYLIFIAGLVYFVIAPSLAAKTWTQLLLPAILFGLVTYATYDLTNLATIKNWPLMVTIIDLIWGMTLSSSVSIITYLIARKLGI